MRRTLLAFGIAVLASMLFAPHKDYWQFLGRTFFVVKDKEGGAYRTWTYHFANTSFAYVPDWCRAWHWFPIFWLEDRNPILWANFAGQTAFVAVLAAVLVNLRERRTRTRQ